MNTQKSRDACNASAWLERPDEMHQTNCPQFRPCNLDGLYPVRGHCVLSRSPGWYMIPSIEEYGRYCTTSDFAQCCWYHASQEETIRAVVDTRKGSTNEPIESAPLDSRLTSQASD